MQALWYFLKIGRMRFFSYKLWWKIMIRNSRLVSVLDLPIKILRLDSTWATQKTSWCWDEARWSKSKTTIMHLLFKFRLFVIRLEIGDPEIESCGVETYVDDFSGIRQKDMQFCRTDCISTIQEQYFRILCRVYFLTYHKDMAWLFVIGLRNFQ